MHPYITDHLAEGGGEGRDREGLQAAQAVVVVWACPSQDLPAMFDLEKVLAGASTGLGGGADVKKVAAAVEKEDGEGEADTLIDRIESQLLEMGMPQQLIDREMEDYNSYGDDYMILQEVFDENQERLADMRDDPETMAEMQREWQQECAEQMGSGGDEYGSDEEYGW